MAKICKLSSAMSIACKYLYLLICLMVVKVAMADPTTVKHQTTESYILENQLIDESSGLALSRKFDNVLWTHNDSGDAAIIYALDFKGHNLGSYFLAGEFPRDWEDMASFTLNGQSYLILADTGDNYKINLSAKLAIYKEPELYSSNNGSLLQPVLVIEFNYPNHKAYDVESIAVDVTERKILLVSKQKKKTRVFELPLSIDSSIANQVITAKKIAKLNYIKKPTSMDISADGKHAVILSYGKVYWFEKSKNWRTTLKKPEKIINFQGLFQPEAISFGENAYQLFISSEKLPAKLLKIDF